MAAVAGLPGVEHRAPARSAAGLGRVDRPLHHLVRRRHLARLAGGAARPAAGETPGLWEQRDRSADGGRHLVLRRADRRDRAAARARRGTASPPGSRRRPATSSPGSPGRAGAATARPASRRSTSRSRTAGVSTTAGRAPRVPASSSSGSSRTATAAARTSSAASTRSPTRSTPSTPAAACRSFAASGPWAVWISGSGSAGEVWAGSFRSATRYRLASSGTAVAMDRDRVVWAASARPALHRDRLVGPPLQPLHGALPPAGRRRRPSR